MDDIELEDLGDGVPHENEGDNDYSEYDSWSHENRGLELLGLRRTLEGLETDNEDHQDIVKDYRDRIAYLERLERRENRVEVNIDHSEFYLNKLFDGKLNEARNIGFFVVDVVNKPVQYVEPGFTRYLMDQHEYRVTKTSSTSGTSDFEVMYYGRPFNNGELNIRPYREFRTKDGELNGVDYYQCSDDLDYLYDKWKSEVLRRRIKKAGLIGGTLIAIGGLITGLSLGLKRTGHDMVHSAKTKQSKLTPAEKRSEVVPWSEIEKAGGKAVILVGDYLYVVIGGQLLIMLLRDNIYGNV